MVTLCYLFPLLFSVTSFSRSNDFSSPAYRRIGAILLVLELLAGYNNTSQLFPLILICTLGSFGLLMKLRTGGERAHLWWVCSQMLLGTAIMIVVALHGSTGAALAAGALAGHGIWGMDYLVIRKNENPLR